MGYQCRTVYLHCLIWLSSVGASRLCTGTLVGFVGIRAVSFNKMVEKDREVGLCVDGVLLKTFGASEERA